MRRGGRGRNENWAGGTEKGIYIYIYKKESMSDEEVVEGKCRVKKDKTYILPIIVLN